MSRVGVKRRRREQREGPGLEQQLLEELQQHLEAGESVVLVTGAGLSVPSGIPPYRGAKNAIWESSVEQWGTRAKFLEDPLLWYNTFWLNKFTTLRVRQAKPNGAHVAVSQLQQRFSNLLVITQNMDTLHEDAGSPVEQMVHVHGQLGLYRCSSPECPIARSRPVRLSLEQIEDLCAPPNPSRHKQGLYSTRRVQWTWSRCPSCEECSAPLMPLTLMFDEKYEAHDFFSIKKAEAWLKKCRLLLFVGTSHAVTITRTAEQLGYRSGAKLYNINLRDTVNGMVNIHCKAERLLPSLAESLLSPSRALTSSGSVKIQLALPWDQITSPDLLHALRNCQQVQELFSNRTLTLGVLVHPQCGEIVANGIQATEDPSSKSPVFVFRALLTWTHAGHGSLLGNILEDHWGDRFLQFLLDEGDRILKMQSQEEAKLLFHLLLSSYSHPLDPKSSLRTMSRAEYLPTLPRQVCALLKRHQNASTAKTQENRRKAKKKSPKPQKKGSGAGDDENESDSDQEEWRVHDHPGTFGLSHFVSFYLDQEKLSGVSPVSFGVQEKEGTFLYVGKALKRRGAFLLLMEMNDELFESFIAEIHPWLRFVFSDACQFRAAGGFGFCMIESFSSRDSPLESYQILSACLSSFTCPNSVSADVFTREDCRRKGFAKVCAFSFARSCLAKGIRPEWSCESDNIPAIHVGQKLGFIPTALVPALRWLPGSKSDAEAHPLKLFQ